MIIERVEFVKLDNQRLVAILRLAAARYKRTDENRLLLHAVIASATIAAIHATCENVLRSPLYALTLASLIGLLLNDSAAAPPHPAPAGQLRKAVAILNLFTALAISAFIQPMENLHSIRRLEEMGAEELTRAVVWAPSSWPTWFYLGCDMWRREARETALYTETCIAQAAEYAPNNYRIWLALGKVRLSMHKYKGAHDAFVEVRKFRDWPRIPEVPGHQVEERE